MSQRRPGMTWGLRLPGRRSSALRSEAARLTALNLFYRFSLALKDQ